MSEIDWSKAPEGATHYQSEGEYLAAWIKIEGDYLKAILDDGEDNEWGHAGLYSAKRDLLIPRPSQAWSGEGLPPVGLPVEWHSDNQTGWQEVVVLSYHEDDAWIQRKGNTSIIVGNPSNFRPIRTAEQIAADEREAAIKEMLEDAGRPDTAKTRDQAQLLYDAGWRKQPKP